MTDATDPIARYLAPAQVAELLCIEVDEVVALVMEGRLRGARLGLPARWGIEEASLAEYLEAQTEEARLIALWNEADAASFPELWAGAGRGPDAAGDAGRRRGRGGRAGRRVRGATGALNPAEAREPQAGARG